MLDPGHKRTFQSDVSTAVRRRGGGGEGRTLSSSSSASATFSFFCSHPQCHPTPPSSSSSSYLPYRSQWGGGNIPTMRHRNERIPASGSPGSPGSFAGLCFYFDVYLIVLIVWRFRWWLRDLDRIGGGFFGILQRFFWDSRRLARAFMGNRIGTGHESQRIPKNLKESPRILENPQES